MVERMLQLCTFITVLLAVHCHSGAIANEAALQSELIPQEFNSQFLAEKDGPYKVAIPMIRTRRAANVEEESTMDRVRNYSRIATCIVIALSAVVELIVYLIEAYM